MLEEHAEELGVFPPERWVCDRRIAVQLILHELSQHLGYSAPPLLERMAEDVQKIHQERPILKERLATATQQTAEC